MSLYRQTLYILATLGLGCVPQGDAASPTPTPALGVEVGRQILFVGTETSGRSFLYTTNENGTVTEELTRQAGALSDEEYVVATADLPSWPVPSPDGNRILFAVEEYDDVTGALKHTLRQLELNSSTFRSITPPPGRLAKVSWSPDGTLLVMEVRNSETSRSELFLLRDTDEVPTRASPEQLSLMGFFPQGRRALVLAHDEGAHHLSMLDLDTQVLTPLSTPLNMDVSHVNITPTGDIVLFQGWSSEMGCSELFRLNVGTTPQAPIPLNLSSLVWSFLQSEHWPDGEGTPPPPPPTPGPQEPDGDDGDDDQVWACVPVSKPVPSPADGLTLSFLAATEPNSRRTDVFTTRLDSQVITPITRELVGDMSDGATDAPQWAPGGEQLLINFVVAGSGSTQEEQLFLASPSDPNSLRSLPVPQGTRPAMSQWSADGERILFWATALPESADPQPTQLRVVDPVTAESFLVPLPADITVSTPLYLDHNTLLY